MTVILDDVVQAKTKADRTTARIEKARQQLDGEVVGLQTARRKFHMIVGPYPLKMRFKGPYREAFDFTDWLYWTAMFVIAAMLTWALTFIIGWIAMFAMGIASVYIASNIRFKYARFTNWGKRP